MRPENRLTYLALGLAFGDQPTNGTWRTIGSQTGEPTVGRGQVVRRSQVMGVRQGNPLSSHGNRFAR